MDTSISAALAVEVLSPANSRRERQTSLAITQSIGIPEVWVFSPEGETWEVLYLENGVYIRVHPPWQRDILKPKPSHVQVNIAEIWPGLMFRPPQLFSSPPLPLRPRAMSTLISIRRCAPSSRPRRRQ
jgi:Uma2 family endonuclease